MNASDAFVAAFLPGTQAGALVDVLFTDEDGDIVHDFTGKLSFSWPEDADQYRLNPDEPDYEPLFAFGYGLSYEDRETIDTLHETPVASGADSSVLFDRGAPLGGWEASLADSDGDAPWRSGPAASPGGALTAQPADLGQQENAVRLTWDGDGAARYVMRHAPLDLTREVNAQFELVIDYLVETPAGGAVTLAFTCGDECASAFDVSASFEESPYGGVSNLAVPLKCLAENGVDLSKVDTFSLNADAQLAIVVSRIALTPGMQLSDCPNPAE